MMPPMEALDRICFSGYPIGHATSRRFELLTFSMEGREMLLMFFSGGSQDKDASRVTERHGRHGLCFSKRLRFCY
ncbi:hypothetical protein GJ744_008536 [Endocarpon pusillum]|uniref:Uncharacterized protein n=1 Tax=Endocarpon pusillum TaxID=364733 RepID=A0A8H7AH06_9EURO|nr:hypothetical protein GJ744_008536 [Endocarpon pusillum]